MSWQLNYIQLSRAQRAILVSAEISVPTKQQFFNETIIIEDWSAGTLSLPVTLFKFWRHCRALVREEQSKSGRFDLTTTNFTKGLLRLKP